MLGFKAMNYVEAVEAVNAGKRIRRPGWDGWDHVIHISRIVEEKRESFGSIGQIVRDGKAKEPRLAELVHFDADASPLCDWGNLWGKAWSPTEADRAATDWELLELLGEWASLEHAWPFT